MRRCRAALAVLTITLMSVLVAGPASAGGPTSVLLVAPGTGQTASLYTGDADYEALAGLVGIRDETGVAGKVDPSGSHAFGTSVKLTWLIHDVEAWRLDQVYLGADGGPWISTQVGAGGPGSIWDSPVVWHSPSRGKELAVLLDRLGVTPGSLEGGSGGVADVGTDVVAPTVAAEDPDQAASRPADTGTPGTRGFVWGLAGLALGVALTVAALRLLPNARPATAELGPDEEPDWSLTDELSSPSLPRR